MAKKRKSGPREKNGRISRAKEPRMNETPREEPADELALGIRAKHLAEQWGVNVTSMQEARNPLYSTFVGILYTKRELSREQYDAGQRVLDLRNLEMKRIACENAIYERFGFSSGILSPEQFNERQRAISAVWGDFKRSIQTAQNEHRGNLWAALQYCLYEDQSFTHMIGDLRLALNVAHRFFSTAQRRKAA